MEQESVASRLKTIRLKKKLSQDRFAKKIGLTGKTISAYETGTSLPPLKILEKISIVYKTPLISLDRNDRTELDKKIAKLKKCIFEVEEILNDSLTF